MMSLSFRSLNLLIAWVALASSSQLFADVTEQVARDFKPLSGYVVAHQSGVYVVDLNEAAGVFAGDLLTVVEPGAELKHPVSGEMLGNLQAVKGVLKITQTGKDFSLAVASGEHEDIGRGDRVHRYQHLTAVFQDQSGRGESLGLRLKRILPGLQWLPPDAAGERPARLVFELSDQQLSVRDGEHELLRHYTLSDTDLAMPAPASEESIAATPAEESAKVVKQTPASPRDQRLRRIATVPGKVTLADFVHHNGRLLAATTDGRDVQIADAREGFRPLVQLSPARKDTLLSLHWWQPATGNALFLAVTGWNDEEPRGSIYTLDGNRLVAVKETIPYILGTFDRDGDGRAEVLLGQTFSREPFFGRKIRRLELDGTVLRDSEPDFWLPRNFNVQSASFADLTGDGRSEIAVIYRKMLYVYSAEEQLLYRSSPEIGGSLSMLTYDVNLDLEFTPVKNVHFELPPVAADLDGDGITELLAVASERSAFLLPGIDPGVKKSWLAVLEFSEGAFTKRQFSPEWEVPVQGMAVDGKRVLIMTPESRSFFGAGGESHLLAFSLME